MRANHSIFLKTVRGDEGDVTRYLHVRCGGYAGGVPGVAVDVGDGGDGGGCNDCSILLLAVVEGAVSREWEGGGGRE